MNGDELMSNLSYTFDSFDDQLKSREIERLTSNVDSHSKVMTEIFLNNGLHEAKKVLDVGCGTGAMIDMFAKLMPNTTFVGLDNSHHILAKAEENVLPNTSFTRGEAALLPFEDNSFDFVYTRLVLMHNHIPERIIREMKRVCKPGGMIICVEVDDETMIFHPYSSEFSDLMRANIAYAAQNGCDRIIGRKLFSLYKAVNIQQVKVITQTSDYEGPYNDIPFPLQLAIGSDQAMHLVEAGLITEAQRIDILQKIKLFCSDPNRFYSGSFMYSIGKKE